MPAAMAANSLPHASRLVKDVLAEEKAVDIGRRRVARNGFFKLDRTREIAYERSLAPGILDPSDFFSRDLSKENLPSGGIPRRGPNMARMTWLSELSGFGGIGRERKHRTFGLGQHANVLPFGSGELQEKGHKSVEPPAADASGKVSRLVSPQLSADMDNDIDHFINQQAGDEEDYEVGAARPNLASPQADFVPATSDEHQLHGYPSPAELPRVQPDVRQVSMGLTVDAASDKPIPETDAHCQAHEAPPQALSEEPNVLDDAKLKESLPVNLDRQVEEALLQSVHKPAVGLTPGVVESEDDHPADDAPTNDRLPPPEHPGKPSPGRHVQASGISPIPLDKGISTPGSRKPPSEHCAEEKGTADSQVREVPAQIPDSSPSELEPKVLGFGEDQIKESSVHGDNAALEPEMQDVVGDQGDDALSRQSQWDDPEVETPVQGALSPGTQGGNDDTDPERALEEDLGNPVQVASAAPGHEDPSGLKPGLQGHAEAEQEPQLQGSAQQPQSQGGRLQGTPKNSKARRTSFAPLPSPHGVSDDAPTNDGQVLAERHNSKSNKQKLKYNKRSSLGEFGLAFDDTEGVRRSKRVRYGPLQYWKNERPVYRRKHKTLPTISDLALVTEETEWPLVKGREKPANFDELELNEANFPQRRPSLMHVSDKRHR